MSAADRMDDGLDDALAAGQAQAFGTASLEAQFRRNDKDKITPSLFNTLMVFEHDPKWRGVIAFDEFAYRITKRRSPPVKVVRLGEWSDLDDVQAVSYITCNHGFEPKKLLVMDAILEVAHQNSFHPVREWLRGLAWDGKPRLARLLIDGFGALHTPRTASLGEDERVRLGLYLKLVAVKWLVGAVARVIRPGCKLDTMVTLEGTQGLLKSTALRALFGDEWFADSKLTIGDKDALAQMQGKWCYEMSEMDAHRKADDTAFKQFLSSQVDRVRWHYGRRAEDVPRQCIFVGTTNLDQYGKDDTGMRRIWPLEVGRIDIELIRADREQMWAEAVHLFDKGLRWWVERDVTVIDPAKSPRLAELFPRPVSEWDLFNDQAEARQAIDAWAYPILEWLEQNNGLPTVTTAQLMGGALSLDKARWSKPEQMRVAAIMRRLGWRHTRVGPKTARIWAWAPPVVEESAPGASLPKGEDDDVLPL